MMTSGYRSAPTTIERTWNRQERASHWSGLRDVSRWPLRAHRHPELADVHRGHALICTGATARPQRYLNTGRRGASIQEQIVAVEVGHALVIMQVEFQQSVLFMFLDALQIQFNSRVPHIPVVCRGVVVGVLVNCRSSSSPSAWANCAENRRVFTGAFWYFSSHRLFRQWTHVLRQPPGCSWTYSTHFPREGETGILKSILSCSPARGEKCAQSLIKLLKWLRVGIWTLLS